MRKIRGVAQTELALEIGVSQESISRYELGKDIPSAQTLVKLAQALGTTTDYLLGLTEQEQATSCKPLDFEEQNLINTFRGLCPSAKQRAIGYIHGAKDNQ